MAPHSSTLAWKIPWMEEPRRLQSKGSLRVGHDWVTSLSLLTFIHWRRKWQPTPVFLPGESQGQGAWWAAIYWVTQSWTRLKWLSNSNSNRSLRLYSLFFNFFFCSSDSMISIVLFSDLQILLLAQICIWIPLVKFSFNILYFLVLEFPHGFILSLLLTFLFCSCEELTHWKRPWCWERLKAEGEGDDRGWDAWMASLTQWPWVWAISGSWWWTGKPGVLQSMGVTRILIWIFHLSDIGCYFTSFISCIVCLDLLFSWWSFLKVYQFSLSFHKTNCCFHCSFLFFFAFLFYFLFLNHFLLSPTFGFSLFFL